MTLKNVTFVFENCDFVTIEGRNIGHFFVGDIETSIYRIACNSIRKMDVAHTILMEIHKNANVSYNEFEQEGSNFKKMVFNRIQEYMDITSIEFTLKENTQNENKKTETYKYYTNWTGDDDFSNPAQKVYISDCGNLYLVINDNKNIEDFFDMEEINDKESVDLRFSIMS